MALKIVRNDITKMNTDAIVNTANDNPTVGSGCDYAVYKAAGFDELVKYRTEKIGFVEEGDAFITPGFKLPAKYIIHAVSPHYTTPEESEKLLRSCYRKSLALAVENNLKSIAFPLIATGNFGYPKEEGLRIAADEINAFLLTNKMDVYIVVFDSKSTVLSERIQNKLEQYIDQNYVDEKTVEEYRPYEEITRHTIRSNEMSAESASEFAGSKSLHSGEKPGSGKSSFAMPFFRDHLLGNELSKKAKKSEGKSLSDYKESAPAKDEEFDEWDEAEEDYESSLYADHIHADGALSEHTGFKDDGYGIDVSDALQRRIDHMSDTFSEYLMFLIKEKNMKVVDVYNAAVVNKRTFSKIKNNKDYHPDKRTALALCVGAKLNLDQSRDLLARAGYAFSPADMTDVIFMFFIENEIFDMVEIDIELENHGIPCFIA